MVPCVGNEDNVRLSVDSGLVESAARIDVIALSGAINVEIEHTGVLGLLGQVLVSGYHLLKVWVPRMSFGGGELCQRRVGRVASVSIKWVVGVRWRRRPVNMEGYVVLVVALKGGALGVSRNGQSRRRPLLA